MHKSQKVCKENYQHDTQDAESIQNFENNAKTGFDITQLIHGKTSSNRIQDGQSN